MSLSVYDSMSRRRELFIPHNSADVTMYVCGPTVYDTPHLGNARPAVVFDVLFRLLRAEYGESNVRYARNITDIDDKIIDRAARDGESIGDLTLRTTAEYHAVVDLLGCLRPTREPRATE
ncbi:MAG: cysteine--tRNA ligase, partial [Oxalobacteraceae bacterium]